MKNIWKWILGIVLVLVVLAGLAGVVYVAHNAMAAAMTRRVTSAVPQGTPNPQRGDGPAKGPMQPGWRGGPGRMPGMPGRGFGFSPFERGGMPMHAGMPFGPGFMLLGGLMRLFPLALLVLLVGGAYLLGKRARVPVAAATPPAPAPATHACPKCAESVLDNAKYCPNCGKKQ